MATKISEVFVRFFARDDGTKETMEEIQETAERTADEVARAGNRMSRTLRDFGERFSRFGENMVDAGDNLSQALALPFLAVGAAAVTAAKETEKGAKVWDQFSKNIKDLHRALAPLGIILLKFANEYLPKLTDKVEQLVTWFTELDKGTQKWLLGLSLLAVTIGPVLAFLGALVLSLGGLMTLLGGLLSPLGLTAIAIVGLGAAAIKSFGGLDDLRGRLDLLRDKAEQVRKTFETLKNRIKEALNFDDLGMTFGPIIRTLVRAIRDGDAQMIGYALAALINRGFEALNKAAGLINWQAVATAIANGIGRIAQFAGIIVPPVIQALSNIFRQIPWQQIGTVIGEQAGRIVPPLAQALSIIIRTLAQNLGPVIPALIQLGVALALAFVDAVFDPATWISIIQAHWWDLLLTGLSLIFLPGRILGIIGRLLGKIPLAGRILQWLWDTLVKLTGPARDRVHTKFGEIWDAIKKPLGEKWQKVKEEGRRLLQEAIDNWKQKMQTKLIELWNKAKGWVTSGINQALGGHGGKFTKAATEWIAKLRSTLASLPSRMRTWGVNAVQGLVDGLSSMLRRVAAIAKKIANTVKQYVGWESPTEKGPGRDSDKWAPNLMNMLTQGIEQGLPKLEAAVVRAATTVEMVGSGDGTVSSGTTYNITVNARTADIDEREMMRVLRRMEMLA